MKRSRRGEDDSLGAGLLLIAMFLFTWFQSEPIWVSVGIGAFIVVLLLLALWLRQRRAIKRFNWAMSSNLYASSTPRDFEFKVKELFQAQGFQGKVTRGSGDGGIDIFLQKDQEKYGVECKRYHPGNAVGPDLVRGFIGALETHKLNQGFFVTTSQFTEAARETARRSQYKIYLINGQKLGEWQAKIQQRNQNNRMARLQFIPTPWWAAMPNWQKASLILLGSGAIFILTTTAVYVGGQALI